MELPAEFWTFKDLDIRHACVKGTAFRAFKGQLAMLREGEDFLQLQASEHGEQIVLLKAAGRLYKSSINPVLLTLRGYQRLLPSLPLISPPAP